MFILPRIKLKSLALLLSVAVLSASCGEAGPVEPAATDVEPAFVPPVSFAELVEIPTTQDEAIFADVIDNVVGGDGPADYQALTGYFVVCKVAGDDPTKAFPFTASAEGPGEGGTFINPSPSLMDGDCEIVYGPAQPFIDPDLVTITENVPDGRNLDRIAIYSVEETNDFVPTFHTAVGPTIQGSIDDGKLGCVAIYYNSEIEVPGGGEGCTPGAWKNRLRHIGAGDETEFEFNTPVKDVWPAAEAYLGDDTLLRALNYGGGSSFGEKVQILLRAATAAVLNASHPGVDYDLTVAQIKAAGNAAILSGDKDTVIDLAEALDDFNNQGCDITSGNNPRNR
jgi:hypothetical protein